MQSRCLARKPFAPWFLEGCWRVRRTRISKKESVHESRTSSVPCSTVCAGSRERICHRRPNALCKPSPYDSHCLFRADLFDSGEVAYEISTVVPCLGQVVNPMGTPMGRSKRLKSCLPVQTVSSGVQAVQDLLDRPDVRGIDSFMNAGPGAGDFKIAIARPSGTQNIDALSLMPDHVQLVKYPALIHLVYKAKDLARITS